MSAHPPPHQQNTTQAGKKQATRDFFLVPTPGSQVAGCARADAGLIPDTVRVKTSNLRNSPPLSLVSTGTPGG